MSRRARVREKKRPHHIISRSIPELDLFVCEEDKEIYLKLIEASAKVYQICILAYCLMDTHVHLLVHPRGGDISKFMRAINNPYARYYNKTYNRRGHLFGERFKNIVIKDEDHLLRTSTYIHNNAKDLLHLGYRSIEDYPYSSIKDYIRPGQGRCIANPSFVFSVIGGGSSKAQNSYMGLLELQSQSKEEFEREMEEALSHGSYETEKEVYARNVSPNEIINVVSRLLGVDNEEVRHVKYVRRYKRYKSLAAICLRIFSDLSLREMTTYFKGHTTACIGVLARDGFRELERDKELFKELKQALVV